MGGKLRTEMFGYDNEKRGPQVSREVLHCVEAHLVLAGVESPREDDCEKRGPQQTTRYLRCISDLGGYWSGLEATISMALRRC